MAGRDKLKARLDALAALAADPTSPATVAELRKALAEKAAHVVAAAARHAGEHGLRALTGPLAAAYARFAAEGAKEDPGCVATLALATALSALDHPDPAPFLHGVRHVQPEASWGPPVDTAPPLRGVSLMALVGLSEPTFPWLAGEMLADPEARCRSAAAQCLRAWGDPALAQALIRLRLRAGEDDPDVLADALEAVLALGGEDGRAWVVGLLDGAHADSAALALGAARVEAALPALEAFLARRVDVRGRRVALVAIGLVRSEEALGVLLRCLEEGGRRERDAVLEALAVFAADPAAAERIQAVADRVGVGPDWRRARA